MPATVLDLAEFDLHLDLVPVNGLREQLDMDALLMGDLKSILVDKRAFMKAYLLHLESLPKLRSWMPRR